MDPDELRVDRTDDEQDQEVCVDEDGPAHRQPVSLMRKPDTSPVSSETEKT